MTSSTRAAVVADPSHTLLALDFDGTLAHIVDDPTRAYAHPRSVDALARLGTVLGQVAIVTGRPVPQALELGGFVGRPGLERLVIHGQYGAERWDAADGETTRPERPAAIGRLAEVLPSWLAERGAGDARLEDKGLAIAIHTRGIGEGLLDSLAAPLADLARELGLVVEPGRQVIELRAPGHDKGDAVRTLIRDLGARHVVFAGDDLGDLPAYDAVDALRDQGVDGLLICSASAEQDALVARADLVLEGPDAVAGWLEELADDLGV
ncbi:trehalose-phosphatase [Aeromicrobium chenweiae]|uniref:Trehalose 6-phosphate phosphatase n=1 Tax=Aeromicrobium chenweiae TaxID=2079793 RepID=A0A2S0WIZ4_9ACTN|nr:trehalose-phosphatase [Aeromicrobium chenweiae]AWB91311.1 trehalose-phosphatase [Aeromicrobium chenweiae]TGN30563.1 trehalose-phosphatase [Aeromicrobium chenweiae]